MPSSSKSTPYSVHPGVAMVQSWIAALPAKTGRSLDEWISLVKKSCPATGPERREWLKCRNKLGANTASRIANRAAARHVEAMFSESKAGLRPLYRRHVFARLKPSTISGIGLIHTHQH